LRLLLVLLHLLLRLLLHLLHLLLQLRHQRRVAAATTATTTDGHGAAVRVGRLAAQIAELVLQIAAALLRSDKQEGLDRLLVQSGKLSSRGHSRLGTLG
tara:strand:- start:95 stop:391 length:297 start_codon:yes stop_codon:yes gene_type:complete